ncbi:MAG: hypothetical protein UU16_C0005G0023 [Candidatus Woesebacteria bacterium GW2011_GWA2_40_7]|uniref:Uncharacterized protein n=1 Tax=Candidatus Woesebacteria bacterium GW2011_GWA2_40_7 TaxID=1618562 RepID=A0A0G0TH13_9BACT|nr:MAG: hypothetical protein UU16_C0005G0023 [Candidatus Woesebacteria bacterium GW2011_GWA2_40_7]
MDKALALFQSQAVQHLLLAGGAQGGDGQDLGLPAGEKAGAVGARQEAYLAAKGADFRDAAPADAPALIQDAGPYLGLELDIDGGQDFFLGEGLAEVPAELLGELSKHLLALILVLLGQGLRQLHIDDFGDGFHRRRVSLGFGDGQLGQAHRLPELLLQLDDALVGLVGEFDRFEDYFLADFLGPRLHHDDLITGADDDQVELTLFQLGHLGIEHQLTVDVADVDGADRSVEGYLGHRQAGRGADDR